MIPDPREIGELYARQALVLGLGALLGLLAAYLFGGVSCDFSAEIERARELGIVSQTILEGYAKSADIVNYLATVGFPVAFALALWLAWSRGRRSQVRDLLDRLELPPPTRRSRRDRIPLLLVVAIVLVLAFNGDIFMRPAFNSHVKAWIFLGEEGEMLEWAQRTLDGQVYGRDYFCLYGPMQIYPLAWALDLFGMNVLVARVYNHVLNLIGYAIAIFFLYKTLRSGLAFIASSLVYLFAFNMLANFSPNTTILRFLLGILPLLLYHLHRCAPNRVVLVLAGLTAGQSLLFSQEAGLCSVATIGLLLLVDLLAERDLRRVSSDGAVFLGSIACSVGPVLIHLGRNGALGAFFESIVGYPRLLMLGFGALPAPSLRSFVADPLSGGALFHHWVLFVYVVSLVKLLPPLLVGRVDRDVRLQLALVVFGLLLFRIALGRSAEFNVLKASHPAFLLCFLHLDHALYTIRSRRPRLVRAGGLGMAALWALSLFLLFSHSERIGMNAGNAARVLLNPIRKFSIVWPGTAVPEIERLGVLVDPVTAQSIREIQAFLSEKTRPGDFVYFFPNEAIYYFLFDRRNPTRYAISYFAISRQQRLELVRDLEEKRPRYVVFSPNTWRTDDIPETVQVPEVVDYLRRTYRPLRHGQHVVIYERTPER